MNIAIVSSDGKSFLYLYPLTPDDFIEQRGTPSSQRPMELTNGINNSLNTCRSATVGHQLPYGVSYKRLLGNIVPNMTVYKDVHADEVSTRAGV